MDRAQDMGLVEMGTMEEEEEPGAMGEILGVSAPTMSVFGLGTGTAQAPAVVLTILQAGTTVSSVELSRMMVGLLLELGVGDHPKAMILDVVVAVEDEAPAMDLASHTMQEVGQGVELGKDGNLGTGSVEDLDATSITLQAAWNATVAVLHVKLGQQCKTCRQEEWSMSMQMHLICRYICCPTESSEQSHLM